VQRIPSILGDNAANLFPFLVKMTLRPGIPVSCLAAVPGPVTKDGQRISISPKPINPSGILLLNP
jgi:hypothetical protein